MENLDLLQKTMNQNAYRFEFSVSYSVFGISDTHCVNMLTYQKSSPTEISEFLQDFEAMERIQDLQQVKNFVLKGYTLPMIVFIHLKTESKNEIVESAPNVATLALADLGSINNPTMERSIAHLKSIVLTLDQTFVSGELRVRDCPLTHLLSPFIGGNSNTLVLFEFLTNASFQTVSDSFLFAESLRKVKNRIDQNFENFLAVEVEQLSAQNAELEGEKLAMESKLKQLNASLSRLMIEEQKLRDERQSLSADNETRRFLLEYNAARMEVEQLQLKERIRALRIELGKLWCVCVCTFTKIKSLVNLDHQRALKGTAAWEENIGRRMAEMELGKAHRQVREAERFYGSQIMSLKERIGKAAEELDRSVEERSIMNSKLQHAQMKIDQLSSQIREVESERTRLERDLHEQNFKQSTQVKTTLEAEIQSLRRQLEAARESERALSMTVARIESKSEVNRRDVHDLERELRALRNENTLLQAKLQEAPRRDLNSVISAIKPPTSEAEAQPAVAASKRPVPSKRRADAAKAAAVVLPVEEVPSTPTPMAAPVSTPLPLIPEQSSLSIGLDTAAKKKIKLPERGRPIASLTTIEVPRAALKPGGDTKGSSSSTNSDAVNSIISNFTVKLPSKK